jgi:hypothetical protein
MMATTRILEDGKLPRYYVNGANAGSTERALKHSMHMLLKYEPDGVRENEIQVALDDLEIMISCVEK